ncbi:hypothetical protein BKA61DRAFT_579551 [Leptodontidium sp. MPI-SDFR-AT-0119]|nr:hypothetical protein BKA61DRAFT_579551 [Leptodontidium sp. MPI-SDFR-AT-0119]
MASAHKEKAVGSSVTSNKTASSPSQVEQPSSQLTTTSKRETAKPFDLLFSLSSTLQTLSTQISTAQLSQADLNGILKSLHTGMAIVKEATSRSEFELFTKLPVELRLKSQQRGKRGSPQDEDRFNAQCKVDGLLVPKIWVNIDADTIWLMNWVRTPYRGTIAPMVPTWAKWERCPQASIMRLAMCKAFVGEFFSINPRIRTDKLRLEELFVLYRAEEGVLDADMIWLVEPNQNARFTALSPSRTGRNDNSLEGESFWEQEAALTKNGIQRVCDWYQNAFVDSQNTQSAFTTRV